MKAHQLTRTEARRIAVQAQLLDAERPTDLVDVVRRLTFLQNDFTAAVAPNAELVLWSRLGSSSFRAADLAEALRDGSLIELRGMIRPAEDIALYRAEMDQWPGSGDDYRQAASDWIDINGAFRQDILGRLAEEGPLTARELPDSCLVPWRSSGWNNNRNVSMMLELLEVCGEVAAVGRRGRERLWDLASRVFPDNPAVPMADALRIRAERRLRSLGLARAKTQGAMIEPLDVGELGEPAVIEGVKGQWRVDPAYLGQPFEGRVALLSPLDRLVFDRKRMEDLFEFDYQLEMYKPAAKRRWGYFALPILSGDRLVGKVDATAHPKRGVLQVDAIHQDVPFSKTLTAAVHRELADLARYLELDLALLS